MNKKAKQAVIWFRFKFADTAAGRMQVQRAADKLFRLTCVSERRSYTEEEVVGIVKAALLSAQAAAAPGQAPDGSSSPDVPSAERDAIDPLAGEEFAE